MKKFTVLSGLAMVTGLLTFVSQASAQITITATDLPTVGLTVVTEKDSTTSLTPGNPSSSAQFWDFSTLGRQQAATIEFMSPASTPYASVFPSANLADSTIGGNGYNFFDTSSISFAAEGAEEFVSVNSTNLQIEINLSPLFIQSALPATYNSFVPPSIASGSEILNQTFSVVVTMENITDSIVYSDTVDAWGTMKMPNAYTYNVLRQNHKEVDYQDVYLYNIFTGWSTTPYERIVSVKNEYNWYTNGIGYILAEMDMDSTSSTVKDIIWDTTAPPPVTTSINEISKSGGISVYPNPCSSQITFRSSGKSEQYLSVYDVAGRKLDQVSVVNGMSSLNTSGYSNGIYFYQLTDNNGALLDKGKFSVQK